MEIKDHRDLIVWRKSQDFAVLVYKISKRFPDSEMFGLTSQLRRAAVSVSANIAEGKSRQSLKEYLRFLYISKGSLAEVDSYVDLSRKLDYIDDMEFKNLEKHRQEIQMILNGLIRSIKPKTTNLKPRSW